MILMFINEEVAWYLMPKGVKIVYLDWQGVFLESKNHLYNFKLDNCQLLIKTNFWLPRDIIDGFSFTDDLYPLLEGLIVDSPIFCWHTQSLILVKFFQLLLIKFQKKFINLQLDIFWVRKLLEKAKSLAKWKETFRSLVLLVLE